MAMQRIGLLYADDLSPWGSCRSILKNLLAAYEELPADYHKILLPFNNTKARYDQSHGNAYLIGLAREIAEKKITKLVFLERLPHVMPLILALKSLFPSQAAKMDYYFHVYGDFTLFPEYWLKLSEELEGLRVSLLCASHRQQLLVRSMERAPASSSTVYCPFPVDTELFSFSTATRNQWREKLNLRDQRAILYSGRLSLQKGILPLLHEFSRQTETDPNSLLLLAGSCDDIGGPTTGLTLKPGYFFNRLEEAIRSLPPAIQDRIRWLGHVEPTELPGLYSAADAFVSLSLYHDEDFGMAPAEALATGLPCLLSDWGGYSSFAIPGAEIAFVPVSVDQRGLNLDYHRLRASWAEITSANLSPQERIAGGKAFGAYFSAAAVAGKLRKLMDHTPSHFHGFGWRLTAPRSPKNLKQGLYKDIYSNYVRGG